MRNKILLIGILVAVLVLAGAAYAVGQSRGSATGTGYQYEQQIQTANQGEDSHLQVQAQTQIQLQAQSGTGTQAQNQNQVQNQGEITQLQNQERETTQTGSGSQNAEQRRSQVANAVQQMLGVADRNGGIGEQVRIIAQNQNQNQIKLESGLAKIERRSKAAKFFIGPNYGEINNANKILEQNREQLKQLKELKNQLANEGDEMNLTQQIQMIEQAHLEVEDALGTARKGFSLFGWLAKLFQ